MSRGKSSSSPLEHSSKSFEVIATEPFERKLKRLCKKHRSLAADLAPIIEKLSQSPQQGKALGQDCYKIRVPIASKGKGKSGGARLITYVRFVNNTVFLIDIYDKSEQATISDESLSALAATFSM
ncbi:MAG: type II toxin-antitoxin system RelE/ParE family toxin [Bacteroidota bacterium]